MSFLTREFLTRGFLTREQVRRVDQIAIQQFGMSGLVLMENAGRGCADVLCELGVSGTVVICCGKGNNGGDGLVIARHLAVRGHSPVVLLAATPASYQGDAAENLAIVRQTAVEIREIGQSGDEDANSLLFDKSEWIVDALLGTGAKGPPRKPIDSLIRQANASAAKRLAIDLPSGLDCDTGEPANPTFRADHTCTLVARKAGFEAASALPFLGKVRVIDIGVPPEVIAATRTG